MKITIDEFCAQWKNGKSSFIDNFEKNIFDFTTLAGDYSRRYFQTSFLVGSFYGTGKAWKPKASKWSHKFPHPKLKDTGLLKKSIQFDGKRTNRNGEKHDKKKIFARGARYDIWTTEFNVPKHGKRGKSKHIGYAAVHNTNESLSNYTLNQYTNKKAVQRQFIGFNPKLEKIIEDHFIDIIFRGFPH